MNKKEKRMKFHWVKIILILTTVSCKSQIGIYCTKPNYTAFCYELKKNGKFKYDKATCTDASQGIGDFEIIGDTIKFNFRKHEIKRGGYQLEKVKEIEKEVEVHLTVIDSQSKEAVMYYDAAMYSDNVLIGGKSGDRKGKVQIKTTFNQKPILIKILFSGYHPLDIEINEGGKYSLNVELVNGWAFPEPRQEKIYRLVLLNRDSFVIGNIGKEKWEQTLYRYEENKKEK